MQIEERITFLDDVQIMEVDFSGVTFKDSAQVDVIYDQITVHIKQTRRQWYFLVNYLNCEVRPEALLAWENRGGRLNLGYSLGSVRFNAINQMGVELSRRAREDPIYSIVVDTRELGLESIAKMRDRMLAKQARARTE